MIRDMSTAATAGAAGTPTWPSPATDPAFEGPRAAPGWAPLRRAGGSGEEHGDECKDRQVHTDGFEARHEHECLCCRHAQ